MSWPSITIPRPTQFCVPGNRRLAVIRGLVGLLQLNNLTQVVKIPAQRQSAVRERNLESVFPGTVACSEVS